MPVPVRADEDELAPQLCGRCRELFPGDPTLHPGTQADWWLCAPCRSVLFGRPPRPRPGPDAATPRRRAGDKPE